MPLSSMAFFSLFITVLVQLLDQPTPTLEGVGCPYAWSGLLVCFSYQVGLKA